MSNGFYKYIAKRIETFFSKSNFKKGTRYCLKLDTLDMVDKVNKELEQWLDTKGNKGEYVYQNGKYKTYTIKISEESQIVVAPKLENVTNDFLTTLRNEKLTENQFSLLIITYSTIDSINSGVGNMASKGMPFHSESIVKEIDDMISTHKNDFNTYETEVVKYGLKCLRIDKYTDKSSVYEYGPILSIINDNKLKDDALYSLDLLPDIEGTTLENSKKIEKRLKNNNEFFVKIDDAFKYGQIEQKLEKDFDNKLIKNLLQKKKDNEKWYKDLDFKDVLDSHESKKNSKNEPLKVEDIFVYSNCSEIYDFDEEQNLWNIKDGKTATKKRNINLIIFNPEKKQDITVEIKVNMRIPKSDIVADGIEKDTIKTESSKVCFDIKSDSVKFAKVEFKDSNTTGKNKHTIKLCIIDVTSKFLDDIKTLSNKIIIRKSNLSKSYIQVPIDGAYLRFNPGEGKKVFDRLTNNSYEFECNYDETLDLSIDEEFFEEKEEQAILVNCGNVHIPLSLKDGSFVDKERLSGKKAFKLKYDKRDSLEYREDGESAYKNNAYFTFEEFRRNLEIEKAFLDYECFAIESADINLLETNVKKLEIPEEVKQCYIDLLKEYKEKKTLPSLAFYNKDLYNKAVRFIESVYSKFSNVESGRALTKEECDLLYLGCVFIKNDGELETIAMSPLHPLNIAYQLKLLNEKEIAKLSDNLIEKLSPLYLVPYIKYEGNNLWKAIDQTHSMEWRYYKKFYKKQHKGSKQFVRKIVKDKILEYQKHFPFLFEEIGNNKMNINIVNMGDCREIFNGFIDYFAKKLKKVDSQDELLGFRLNIYSNQKSDNYFYMLSDFVELKKYIEFLSLKDIDVNEIALALVGNLRCFYYRLDEEKYNYSHITFFEMDPKNPNSIGKMDNITTAASLGGLISAVPSILDGDWFKTGFGFKYAAENKLTLFAKKYNSLYRIAKSSSSYDPEDASFTEIKNDDNEEMEKLFTSSNWIVFIDPHVDLSFFKKGSNSVNSELMIIHYSDQLSSSSGYDDITVTRKSKQYCDIIKEQLEQNNIDADDKSISSVINMFNAINGEWMLKLISNKKLYGAADSYFSREKLSILSAIKLCLAYYYDSSIIWIPVSLEELLRVSGGIGLSQSESILSAKNLGFPNGPTCDDILLVGIGEVDNKIKLYIHPVEVKIGENSNTAIEKATSQIKTTYLGFKNALAYKDDRIMELKLIRNYFIDIILDSCKKLELYNIYPECAWERVLDLYIEKLINDEFDFSEDHLSEYGMGSIVSFRNDTTEINISNDGMINNFDFPKHYGFEYMIKDVNEIRESLNLEKITKDEAFENKTSSNQEKTNTPIDFLSDNDENKTSTEEEPEEPRENVDEKDSNVKKEDKPVINDEEKKIEEIKNIGIKVNFGKDLSNGEDLIWNPNDTNQLFHTNTGIIGTMGTGKTQFTKSMITQLYRKRKNNYESDRLGILIFDYKGDYNESNNDFIKATNAKVLKPYHLPFNPLALTKSQIFKPLLPLHVANTFKDTLTTAYHLGHKQSNTLFTCIDAAYKRKGVDPNNPDTWNKSAPTFEDVYFIYENDDDISKNDSLAAAMQKLHNFQIFESDSLKTKTLYDVLDGVVVIDLNGYDPDIQSTVVAITLDQFYSQMQASGESKMNQNYRELTKMILVDEADNFMKEDYPVLRNILKEGRSFGVGTILSTQFLDHFMTGEDDYSKYIITWIVHNVDDLKRKDVDYIFKVDTKNDDGKEIFSDIKKLEKHHSIVKINNNNPYYIADKPFWRLYNDMVDNDEI